MPIIDERMSRTRRLLMGIFTLGVFLVLVEGAAQLGWQLLEAYAFADRFEHGEKILRNDAINFMKQADGVYGYVLKPGFERGSVYTNENGFAQRDLIPLERVAGSLRLVALGESTTHGHHVDSGNYPAYLRRLLARYGSGYTRVEVLNAGVSGWVSGQIALRAERELAAYRPDVALLYVGWNDFQSYDPFEPPSKRAAFDRMYGSETFRAASGLKTIALLDAAKSALVLRLPKVRARMLRGLHGSLPEDPSQTYYFYLSNLDRIVDAFRAENPEVQIAISTLVGRWPHGTLGRASGTEAAAGHSPVLLGLC